MSMAKKTTRDEVWIEALYRTMQGGEAVTTEDMIDATAASERTARDVLKTMEDAGILSGQRRGPAMHFKPNWRPDEGRRMDVVAAVLDERDATVPGTEIEAGWVLDRLEADRPRDDITEGVVEDVMSAMAGAGMIDEHESISGDPIFEAPGAPSECEWCGAPFPEAGRHKIESFDEDGDRYETAHVCGSCISEF